METPPPSGGIGAGRHSASSSTSTATIPAHTTTATTTEEEGLVSNVSSWLSKALSLTPSRPHLHPPEHDAEERNQHDDHKPIPEILVYPSTPEQPPLPPNTPSPSTRRKSIAPSSTTTTANGTGTGGGFISSFIPSVNLSSFIPKLSTSITLFMDDEKKEKERRGSSTNRGVVMEDGEDGDNREDPGPETVREGEAQDRDLSIEEALANGQTFEDPADVARSTTPKPGFPTLSRTPSSAFMAASQTGRVNPLSMQAIARKGSENEAMRVYREREERDRENSNGSARPNLGRKESWTKAAMGVVSGRESPSSLAGGRNREGSGEGSVTRERQPSLSFVTPPAPSTLTASSASSISRSDSIGRKGFFKRFGRNRTASSISATTVGTPVDEIPWEEGGLVASPSIMSGEFEKEKKKSVKGKDKDKEKVRYVKVKTKNKTTSDFSKLFLAQELFVYPTSPTGTPSSPVPPLSDTASTHSDEGSQFSGPSTTPGTTAGATGAKKKQHAVWAIRFSVDGKYLAVGGKDGVVRVWEVLSNPSAREAALNPDPVDLSPDLHPHSPPIPGTPSTITKSKPSNVKTPASVMPVFSTKPIHEFKGHDADVLDLSWSKNNFLLSSSMDKTVRLWHVSRDECLCAFQHLDFVTSIAFHPKDDRFFLSGSLDCKLRLWNIPEKRVHAFTEVAELITSCGFSSDGKLAIAGLFTGICMFFEVESFRYHTQIVAKSTRGKNSKGKKVTSISSFPLPSNAGERLLVTTNDSRMRLFHFADKLVETKYSGHENTSSQIRASFSDDGRYIISGSEDRQVYIWDSGMGLGQEHEGWKLMKKKDENKFESFQMSANIVTCATFAPTLTRETLSESDDPVFTQGVTHVAPLKQTLSGASLAPFPTGTSGRSKVVPITEESPAENAIIVVADDTTGILSVFRNSVVPRSEPPKGMGRRGSKAMSEMST